MNEPWIKHPTVLYGKIVDLIPLEEDHFDELYLAASDKELWKFIPSDCAEPKKFRDTYLFALAEREKGNHYPFVIYNKEMKSLLAQQDSSTLSKRTKN